MTKGRNIMNIWNAADDKGGVKGRDIPAGRDNSVGI